MTTPAGRGSVKRRQAACRHRLLRAAGAAADLGADRRRRAEGGLYEVDMRLRPTGNKGPVAVSLESFPRYHDRDAWTWERLALTRARVVAGPAPLAERVEVDDSGDACGSDARTDVAKDAREMREKLAAQFPGRNRWDLKFAPGGLVDIEFIAQALQLQHAHAHPDVLQTNTIAALAALGARQGARSAAIKRAHRGGEASAVTHTNLEDRNR